MSKGTIGFTVAAVAIVLGAVWYSISTYGGSSPAVSPVVVCPKCGGTGKSDKCRKCRGKGYRYTDDYGDIVPYLRH